MILPDMLFCLSLCDETRRVILDLDYYGPTLAMVEGRDWQEAREAAIRNPVMDGYTYVPGHGWYARQDSQTTDGTTTPSNETAQLVA